MTAATINAPDRQEAVFLPDGVKKLEYIPDPRMERTASFKIEREDHTIGNLLRMQLLRYRDVVFVGYRHPHPLQHHIILRVQTKGSSEGATASSSIEPTPVKAVMQATHDLMAEITLLKERFEFEIAKFEPNRV
eukprot:CAMPEP_0184691900 /NCGR_PEP_ID=MMETSP0313-20130426/600_1 /TAXON_ID=2792 /ORGANISM="Porphyridium aerugineum, Strain SAG 1380-2" /LENGTH=133 /DNA_ID=CAMNT_0027149679 /DNA_START=75 /DNA_END=476 /DNA_ORIENTATION=+